MAGHVIAPALETIDARPSVVMLLDKALRPVLPCACGYYQVPSGRS
jgi:hypothetical protein